MYLDRKFHAKIRTCNIILTVIAIKTRHTFFSKEIINGFRFAGLVSAAFALPHVMDEKEAEHFVTVGVYAFLLYSHSGVWLIVFFFDLIFSVHHRSVMPTIPILL